MRKKSSHKKINLTAFFLKTFSYVVAFGRRKIKKIIEGKLDCEEKKLRHSTGRCLRRHIGDH